MSLEGGKYYLSRAYVGQIDGGEKSQTGMLLAVGSLCVEPLICRGVEYVDGLVL